MAVLLFDKLAALLWDGVQALTEFAVLLVSSAFSFSYLSFYF